MSFVRCNICDIVTYIVVIERSAKGWPRVVESMLIVPKQTMRAEIKQFPLANYFIILIHNWLNIYILRPQPVSCEVGEGVEKERGWAPLASTDQLERRFHSLR